MWFDLLMETKLTHANDNFDPWSSIGLAASMILNRLRNERLLLELREEQQEEAQGNAQRCEANDKEARENGSDIDQRLNKKTATEIAVSLGGTRQRI
jgi:hypothetical protein